MKDQLIQAFKQTTLNNQIVVHKASFKIKALQTIEGYCLTLMEIIDSQLIDDQIRIAALIQLKNTIQCRWAESPQTNIQPLSIKEKQKIRGTLFKAMTRCNLKNSNKLYKIIVTLVVAYDCQFWMPTLELSQTLKNNQGNIYNTLSFVQSVIQAFSDRPNPNKVGYTHFLQQILPLLYQIAIRDIKCISLVYLIMKIISRILKTQLSLSLKQGIFIWMPLIKQIIDQNTGIMSLSNCDKKSTIDSYFYRAKKWACRIVSKSFQIYSFNTQKPKAQQFFQYWISNFGLWFLDSLLIAVTKPNLDQTVLAILKTFTYLVQSNPTLVLKYSDYLMYSVLPTFMRLTEGDQRLLNNDELEFFRKQQNIRVYDNIKNAATQLWISFANFESESRNSGSSLRTSLMWIYQQFAEQDLIKKQMLLMILCRAKQIYLKYDDTKSIILQMIQKHVIPMFSCQVVLVKARIIQIFQSYGSLNFSSTIILQEILQFVYKSFTQQGKILINVKATLALNQLIRNQTAIKILKPYLKELLLGHLRLISCYSIQQIVCCLQNMVVLYKENITPFSIQLMACVVQQFESNTNSSQQDLKEKDSVIIAQLKLVKEILKLSLQKDILTKLEESLVKILEKVFACKEYLQYYSLGLQILSIYLAKLQTFTSKIWFFYPCILYHVLGLPETFKLQCVSLCGRQKNIFNSMSENYSKQKLYLSIDCIRNYIFLSPQTTFFSKDMFQNCMGDTIFQICKEAYNINNREPLEILSCSSILINVLQNIRCPLDVHNRICQVMNSNFNLATTRKEEKITHQLFCLLMSNNSDATLEFIEAQIPNGLLFLEQIILNQALYQKEYEISRVIKGLSSIFAPNRSQSISYYMPMILNLLTRLIGRLASVRCLLDEDQQIEEDEEQNVFVEFWNEEKQKIRTNDDKIDAALFFQTIWSSFQINEPNKSAQLTNLLTAKQLRQLRLDLNNAKKDFISTSSFHDGIDI